MPHFLLTFGDASRPSVDAVIIEAPSMFALRHRRAAGGVLPVDKAGAGSLPEEARNKVAIKPTVIIEVALGGLIHPPAFAP